MRISSRIAVNAVTKWVAQALHGLVGLVLVPFLIAQLGKPGYGVASLAGVIVGLSLLADLGLRAALSRQLAEQVARKDDRRYNELASTAMALYLGIGSVLAVVCFVLAPKLATYFAGRKGYELSPDLLKQAIFLVRWYASSNLLVTFITPVYGASITSNNRFDLANYTNIVVNLVRLAALLLVLGLTDWQLYGWAAAMFLADLALLVCYWVSAHRARPTLRIRPHLVSRSALRPLFGLGGYLFMFQLTDLIGVKSDPLVLSRLLGPAALAVYYPALGLASMVRPMVDTLSQQLYPLTTGFHVAGQRRLLQEVLIRGTRLTWLMGIASSVVLIVFADPIMRLWLGRSLGSDYIHAARALQVWAMVDLVNFSAGTQGSVVLGMQRLGFLAWTQLPFSFVNVVASILLVMHTDLGVLGVLVPTLVITAIRRPMVSIYVSRVVKLPIRTYVTKAYLGPLIVLGALLAGALLLRHLAPPVNVGMLLGEAAVTTLAWAALAWYVGLQDEDRRALLDMYAGFRRRLRALGTSSPEPADNRKTGVRE